VPEQAPPSISTSTISVHGQAGVRRGIIAASAGRVEKGIIRPHEKIFAAAREDGRTAENPESEYQSGADDVPGPRPRHRDTLAEERKRNR